MQVAMQDLDMLLKRVEEQKEAEIEGLTLENQSLHKSNHELQLKLEDTEEELAELKNTREDWLIEKKAAL